MDDSILDIHAEIESRHWWFEGRRRIVVPIIDKLMAEHPGRHIVDVGCGTGGTVSTLSGAYPCVGIDASETAIALARQTYTECAFRHGAMPESLTDLTPTTGLFLIMDVLEHIQDDSRFLADLVGAASPGSHILMTVPAKPEIFSAHDEAVGHFRRYEAETLGALWRGLPVDVMLLSYFNAYLYPLIYLVRRAGNVLGRSAGRQGTDFSTPPAPINAMLAWFFGLEGRFLIKAMIENRPGPFSTGASLIAVLRRREDG